MGNSIPEQLAAAWNALLPTGTATAFGRREDAVNAAPPRVVTIPLGASEIAEAKMPGGQTAGTTTGRQLYVRFFNFQFKCHAADFEATENLYSAAVKAIRKIAHAPLQFSDEEWLDQQEGEDGWVKFGTVIAFKATIQIPLYEYAGGRTTLTATPPILTTATIED